MNFRIGETVLITGLPWFLKDGSDCLDDKIGVIKEQKSRDIFLVKIDDGDYFLNKCYLKKLPVKDVFYYSPFAKEYTCKWISGEGKSRLNEKENRNMRNETLERWYEKNWDAINAANIKKMNELINEDSLVKRVSADIEAINTYLREELKIDNDQLTFNKELVTTDETDDKTDLCMKKMDELRAALDEKKADVYALLSMCDGNTGYEYEPFELLKTQGIIDEYLNIVVKNYDLSA